MAETIWRPSPDRIRQSPMRAYLDWLARWFLETVPELAETLVVGFEQPDDAYRLGLFLVPAPGRALDDSLREQIIRTLRTRLTARHIPDEIVEAPAVPHTLNGKKLEVPIEKRLRARRLEQPVNLALVDDPAALRWYATFAAEHFNSPEPG